MTIEERKNEILESFPDFLDWEEKYRCLIDFGKKLPPMDESLKNETFRIKGCQSQAWLAPVLKDGLLAFEADSDAAIVKGILGVLVFVYSQSTPKEIVSLKPTFLKEAGIEDHLSMNRRNGLAEVTQLIETYAQNAQKQTG